ncbi:MAG: hypothetical protein ACD_80C00181G0007 [uncultured bacterium (gcode 4)]|uniref:Uncharacterized protein n=1 Tax=uncultured bacterium (gcode 4) TaxID=1234023 RepID=K1XH91_9BACT|nr:MAG: hypothetical protein ACD_80C00181G0007 [uncultured bacterium (gcode 4)]
MLLKKNSYASDPENDFMTNPAIAGFFYISLHLVILPQNHTLAASWQVEERAFILDMIAMRESYITYLPEREPRMSEEDKNYECPITNYEWTTDNEEQIINNYE